MFIIICTIFLFLGSVFVFTRFSKEEVAAHQDFKLKGLASDRKHGNEEVLQRQMPWEE